MPIYITVWNMKIYALNKSSSGLYFATTLHRVREAVACFPIRFSRLNLIFSVSANSIRRIVTVAVSNRLNPIVVRIRWEKNRLANITSRRLLKRNLTMRSFVSPCANRGRPPGDRPYQLINYNSRLISVNRKMSVCSHASGSAQTPACSGA